MADSDDYYEDSLELDEDALASIQATEERFGASLSQASPVLSQPQPRVVPPPQRLSHPPPPKRLKTTHGWIEPGINYVKNRSPVQPSLRRLESVDDNPEIVVNPDGSYVFNKSVSSAPHRPTSQPAALPPSLSAVKPLSHGPANITGAGSIPLESEIVALRNQLSELRAVHASTVQSLREAQDEHFLKAGEVSNLRRTLDKTSREHAEAVAKIRAEKEAAEKVRAELQAKLKEETDRMATRLLFKHQEQMESSMRKGSWPSTRSRRIVKGPPLIGTALADTPTRKHSQTPPPFMVSTGRSPSQPTPSHELGGVAVRQPLFKGFQNAFTDSAPVLTKSPTKAWEKRPKNGEEELFFGVEVAQGEVGNDMTPGLSLRRDLPDQNVDTGLDVNEEPGENVEDERQTFMEVDEPLEEPIAEVTDWEEELRRIVFNHLAPGTDKLTLQELMATPLPAMMSPEKKHAFFEACKTILAKCGVAQRRHPEDSEWEIVVDSVASAFIDIGELLNEAGSVEPLVALLDLMNMLVLYTPAFVSQFLGPAAANDILHRPLDPQGPSQLLCMLENIVQDHIAIPVAQSDEAGLPRVDLGMAVVSLMESLYWNVKDGFEEQLEMISGRCQALGTLLRIGQPPKLVERTLRLLVLIATHKFSFQIPLAPTGTPGTRGSPPNAPHLPVVEELCRYLVDPAQKHYYFIQQLIITFLMLLHQLHRDAFNALLGSVPLVPSIVVCISVLSRMIWEDDPDVMNSTGEAKSVVQTIYLSMNFLHQLVFALEGPVDISHRLMEVAHSTGPFNGITHMFMVTFGRLSWAEVPDWLGNDCRSACEIISELAIQVIETVVVGPELDSLWAVWHPDEELDEEEVEAQQIQIE